jgi:hypothetical protein
MEREKEGRKEGRKEWRERGRKVEEKERKCQPSKENSFLCLSYI